MFALHHCMQYIERDDPDQKTDNEKGATAKN